MELPGHSFTFTDLPQCVSVGKYSSIAANCIFHQDDNHYYVENHKYVSTYNFKKSNKPYKITIGNDVWIGNGARFLAGSSVGDGCVVGAGAVIAKSFPPYSVIVGNPGRIIKKRFSEEIIDKLLKIRWWDKEDTQVGNMREDFEDAEEFVKKYA